MRSRTIKGASGETIGRGLGGAAPLIPFLVLGEEEKLVFLFLLLFFVCLEARELAEAAPLIYLRLVTVMVKDRG